MGAPQSTSPQQSTSASPSPAEPGPARDARRPTPAVAQATPESEGGILSLLIVPAAEVTLDGGSLGTVSLRDIPLSVGAHSIIVEHPEYRPLPRKVHIRKGATYKLVLDLAEKAIRKQP